MSTGAMFGIATAVLVIAFWAWYMAPTIKVRRTYRRRQGRQQ